jgi:WD40 repeat protein
MWDVVTGQQALSLSGHRDKVFSVAISADGKWIVSGGRDETVRVWDAVTGKQVHLLLGHTKAVLSVALLADGRRVISGSLD